jgi:hypothetical protein
MLVKLLKTSRPMALLTFFLLAALFLTLQLWNISPYTYGTTGYPLFDLLQQLFFENKWLASLFSFSLCLLTAMGLNNLITEKGVLKYNTILPATILLVSASPFAFSPVWISQFILLFVLGKLLSMYQKDRVYAELYDSGLLIGIASLFYPPTLPLFFLIYIANIIYAFVGWRNFFIPLVGLASPYLIFFTYLYWTGNSQAYLSHYALTLSFDDWSWSFSQQWTPFLLMAAVVVILSFKEFIQWIGLKSLRSRKSFLILLVCFLLSLTGMSFVGAEHEHLLLASIPFAALAGNYFLFARKWWWYESVFILFIFSAIYFHISAILGW